MQIGDKVRVRNIPHILSNDKIDFMNKTGYITRTYAVGEESYCVKFDEYSTAWFYRYELELVHIDNKLENLATRLSNTFEVDKYSLLLWLDNYLQDNNLQLVQK
jgi:hypothetical protein